MKNQQKQKKKCVRMPHGEAGIPKRQRIQKGQPQWWMWNHLSYIDLYVM